MAGSGGSVRPAPRVGLPQVGRACPLEQAGVCKERGLEVGSCGLSPNVASSSSSSREQGRPCTSEQTLTCASVSQAPEHCNTLTIIH